VRLVQSLHAVHAIGQQHPVPVNRGVLGKVIRHQDPDTVTFDRLDGGTRRLAVVTPCVDDHPGGKLALHLPGDEVEDLHATVHHER